LLNSYDVVQFVTGTPPWMCAARHVRRPKFLWVATMTRPDRASRLQKEGLMRRCWMSAMTRIAESYERRGLRIAGPVFALSDYTLRSVRTILGPGSGVLATCGVDTDVFIPRPSSPKRYILCVGRLDDPRKNTALLVEAYARLRRKYP